LVPLVALAVAACGQTDPPEAIGDPASGPVDASTTAVPDPTEAAPASSTTTPAAPTTTSAGPTTQAVPTPLAGYVVVVDPGHNGANGSHPREINRRVDAGGSTKACNTTGTGDSGFSEAEFTWQTAQRLRDALVAAGATVVLTRPDNGGWGPCVDQRGLTAGRAQADVLVSIHADGSGPTNHGFHVISATSIAGYTDETWSASARLAGLVRDRLVDADLSPSNYLGTRGLVQRGDLGTLNRAPVPAVMLESGNMHHGGDLALLRSTSGQQRIALAIVAALVAFRAST
jgi:N-acetylmuramoyl-L-alanine amidase